ncbi:MAG: mannose-6-phosphate isomerase, class I [bacterium]
MKTPTRIKTLKNPIKEYKWGSKTAIPELLGIPNKANKPQAELWMGAHPGAPSIVVSQNIEFPLIDYVKQNPEVVLGKRCMELYGPELPFLFKVLAAADPLSIQAHPNRDQAKAGFKRENDLGIALDAYNRNYKDDNHKPEIISAITPFWALKGFRKIESMVKIFKKFNIDSLRSRLHELEKNKNKIGLKKFYTDIMSLDAGIKQESVKQAVDQSLAIKNNEITRWIIKLNKYYPGDIGVLSPIMLNLICLKPGQALFLSAGEPHVYLEGVGVELMANSDNVLRGGLTPKHVDAAELINTLTFSDGEVDILTPSKKHGNTESEYSSLAQEFKLSIIEIDNNSKYTKNNNCSAEILICMHGACQITDIKINENLEMKKGASILIPANVETYEIKGNAKLYKAAINL